jgi:hypothetical protein
MGEAGKRQARISQGGKRERKAEYEQRWKELAQDVLLEMGSWREEHPTATLQEIENEVASADSADARGIGGRDRDEQSSRGGRQPSRRAASPLSEVWRSAASARQAGAQATDDGRANGAPGAQLGLLPHL